MVIDKFFGEYRFLSNFYLSVVEFEGYTYPSIEHAYQAAKTHDPLIREKIREDDNPSRAKLIGKRLELRPGWDSIRIIIMEDLVRQKFTKHEHLKKKLLDTGNAELIEGNWWGDTFWGVCKGKGENNLGKLLMKIRQELNEKH